MAPLNTDGPCLRRAAATDSGGDGRAKEEEEEEEDYYKVEIVWANIGKFVALHSFALAGVMLLPRTNWKTVAMEVLCYYLSTLV